MKKILHLASNLLQENRIILFINTAIDVHFIYLRFLVNLTDVIP